MVTSAPDVLRQRRRSLPLGELLAPAPGCGAMPARTPRGFIRSLSERGLSLGARVLAEFGHDPEHSTRCQVSQEQRRHSKSPRASGKSQGMLAHRRLG